MADAWQANDVPFSLALVIGSDRSSTVGLQEVRDGTFERADAIDNRDARLLNAKKGAGRAPPIFSGGISLTRQARFRHSPRKMLPFREHSHCPFAVTLLRKGVRAPSPAPGIRWLRASNQLNLSSDSEHLNQLRAPSVAGFFLSAIHKP